MKLGGGGLILIARAGTAGVDMKGASWSRTGTEHDSMDRRTWSGVGH